MSTEKIIKNQAKDSLKGSWSVIITAILAVCTVFILIEALMYCFCILTNCVDLETGNVIENKKTIYTALTFGAFVFSALVSPLFNGIFKMFCKVSSNNTAEIYDLFYFFKGSKRYTKTVLINVVLMFIWSIFAYGLDVYVYASSALGASLKGGINFDLTSLALLGALLASVIIKAALYLLIVHFPLIAYAYDDSMSALKYMFGFIGFSFRSFAKSVKLVLSFLGWILISCAFVVPAFYAFPYLMTSLTTSAKWLFSLERNRM